MYKLSIIILILLVFYSCKKEMVYKHQVDVINQEIKNIITESKSLFDWNQQSTDFIYKALQSCDDKCITIGFKTEFGNCDKVLKENVIQKVEQLENKSRKEILLEENEKLSTLKFQINKKETIELIRNFKGVDFVEITNFKFDREFFISDDELSKNSFNDNKNSQRISDVNPGDFDFDNSLITYDQYIQSTNGRDADVIRNHNLNYIYDSLKKFDGLEVAVLDNGVLPDFIPFAQVGYPNFKTEGYFSPIVNGKIDGVHPQNYDLLGLSQFISGLNDHGTRQSGIVYSIIPKGKFRSVRCSQFVFFIFAPDFSGTTKAILSMADDPSVKIISMSMGTVFVNNEMKRAVQYFTSKNKIFVSASGTFLEIPWLKDLIGVVFPANMPETIATTGIKNTQKIPMAFLN
jgi:serine protease